VQFHPGLSRTRSDGFARSGGTSLAALNERLRAEFECFRMDTMPDGTVGVQPVLRARDFDVAAAYSE